MDVRPSSGALARRVATHLYGSANEFPLAVMFKA